MYLDINECNLYVRDEGPTSAQPIITLHGGGGMGDSRTKRAAYGGLTDEYRLITFDQRGCGKSEDRGTTDFAQWSADVDTLRQTLDLGSVIVAGGSSGGYLALEYALRYPENVQALILRGTGAQRTDTAILEKQIRESGLDIDWDRFDRYWNGQCIDNDDMALAFWDIMPFYAGKGKWDPEEGRKRWEQIHWHYQTNNYVINHVFPGWNLVDRLPEIGVPTLIVHGERDWVIPVQLGEELHRGIPDSQLEIFERCGHSPHLEENDRFLQIVRNFLAANDL